MKTSWRNLSRRKFFGLLGVSGLGAALDTRWLEPKWLGIGQHTVPLRKGRNGEPLKVLQLSDFHASKVVSLDFIAEAVRLGLSVKPDLVLLTGDFITRKFDQFGRYTEILSLLTKTAPCYACLGNHDGGFWSSSRQGYADTDRVRNLLSKSGIELLHNRATRLRVKDFDLRLVGLGDWWAKEFDPGTAFASVAPAHDEAVIVMSHNPDTKDLLKSYPWDLMVCGTRTAASFICR